MSSSYPKFTILRILEDNRRLQQENRELKDINMKICDGLRSILESNKAMQATLLKIEEPYVSDQTIVNATIAQFLGEGDH